MKIADAHAHIFPAKIAEKAGCAIGEFYNTPMHHIPTPQILLEEEAKAGIEAYIVSSSATCAAQAMHINDFIAESIRLMPGAIGFGTLFPTMEDWEEALERIVSLGLRGIKIHSDFQKIPIDIPEAVPMYRAIAKAGLPVLFHMGDDRYDYSAPERLENLIRQVPDLVALAAHFGGWQAWEQAYDHILPENVFYDTSSSLMFVDKDWALAFIEKAGSHRILFGSDFPMWTPQEEVERFLGLGLDKADQDKILYGNFERLFLSP